MKFFSKRDWWVSVIMLGLSFSFIGITFIKDFLMIYRVMFLLFGVLVLWIYYGTFYVISENFLILRCGPLKVKLQYKNIDSIEKTKNILSSIALSTDKLKIKTKGKGLSVIYISPENKEVFIKELSRKCDSINLLMQLDKLMLNMKFRKGLKFMEILIERIQRAYNLTYDLAQSLSNDAFTFKLKDIPSNTIGQQFWCIIGARESYLKAIANEGWSGFSCSLNDTNSKDKIIKCLEKSLEEFMSFVETHELSKIQIEFLVTLLEHEIQHHGQLIRYIYGNKLNFPKSWNERYTV